MWFVCVCVCVCVLGLVSLDYTLLHGFERKGCFLLELFRFGVACPNDAEKVIHGLRACMHQHWFDDDFGVLKIDNLSFLNVQSTFPSSTPGSAGVTANTVFFGTPWVA